MPVIKEMSNMEKITLLYKGETGVLDRTNISAASSLRLNVLVDRWFKRHGKPPDKKFESNKPFFCLKFDSSFPKMSVDMRELYLKRRSQMTPFQPRKVSRKDLERILKWGLFYNPENHHFTVPCGGGLYHYEIYLFLFRSLLLPLGLYRYNPQERTLALIKRGDFMEKAVQLFNAYLDRLKTASGLMAFVSNQSISREKYDFRADRFVLLDTGHLMHSMNLALTAAGFGVSNIGAGKDQQIIKFIGDTGKLRYVSCLYFGGRDPNT